MAYDPFSFNGALLRYEVGGDLEDIARVAAVDRRVPGARAMVRVAGEGVWRRLQKLLDKGDIRRIQLIEEAVVDVPFHGWPLVEAWAVNASVDFKGCWWENPWRVAGFWPDAVGDSAATDIDWLLTSDEWTANDRDWMEDVGRTIAAGCVDAGLLPATVDVDDVPTPTVDALRRYQAAGIAWFASRTAAVFSWPPGTGKTFGGSAAAAAWLLGGPGHARNNGGILVLGPAKSRRSWFQQMPQYSCFEPHMIQPRSSRAAGYEAIDEYLRRMRSEGRLPVVCAGTESLPDYEMEITRSGFRPTVLIVDESHEIADSKLFQSVAEADGDVTYSERRTKTDLRVKRAVSFAHMAWLPSIEARLGLTATLLDDGRPRRLHPQFNALMRHGLGSYWDYARRYCGAKMGDFGMDDSGRSNMPELQDRMAWTIFEVSQAEARQNMPATQLDVIWLDPEDQDKPDAMSREITRLGKLALGKKTAGRDASDVSTWLDAEDDLSSSNPATLFTELRLAEACSRKRTAVVDMAIEELRAGGQVVIFAARRRQCEMWAEAIQSRMAREMTGDMGYSGPAPKFWWAHGGTPPEMRNQIIDAYQACRGPACLVTTGQAMGTSLDGFQRTTLAIIAMLPWKPGAFSQWRGRFERLGGIGTRVVVMLARATYDERIAARLSTKIEGVQSFLLADDLNGVDEALLGLPNLEEAADSILAMIMEEEFGDDWPGMVPGMKSPK